MEFINILKSLKEQYSENYVVRENGTMLLAPGKIPKSRHILFKPLSKEYIQKFLIDEYQNTFPKDYIEFLMCSNGANLHTIKFNSEKVSFACCMFVIFGLPLTPPFNRPLDMEEPYDMRIEDLARHKDIPKTWLKCGTYIRDNDFNVQNDIFIDTETSKVFACIKNQKDVVDSWNTLDECFCSIYNSFNPNHTEYDKVQKKFV